MIKRALTSSLIAMVVGLAVGTARGVDASGTWNVNAGGNWSDPNNWVTTPAGNVPDGAGLTADLTADIDGAPHGHDRHDGARPGHPEPRRRSGQRRRPASTGLLLLMR